MYHQIIHTIYDHCFSSFIVVLTDGTPPEISNCPGDIPQNAPPDGNSVVVWWFEPTATSAGGAIVTLQDPSHRPGDKFEIGTTTVNYIFLDSIGLRSTCSFRITGKLAIICGSCRNF